MIRFLLKETKRELFGLDQMIEKREARTEIHANHFRATEEQQ